MSFKKPLSALVLFLTSVSAGAVAYYYGRYLPLLRDAEVAEQRRKSAEMFRLRTECADQARLFEADYRNQITAHDIESSVFRNHYDETDGHCYIDIVSRSEGGEREVVMDATEGIASKSVAWRYTFDPPFQPDEKDRSSEHNDAFTKAKIRRLMGDQE